MESWKKFLPDYEFMLWNFERFPKDKSKWVRDAFDNKKYAFAADYIRIYACLLYTSPSPRDKRQSRMPSSA